MALLLTVEEIERTLSMPAVIEALETAYRDLAAGRAANRHRSDILSATDEPGIYHNFKTMDGCVPRFNVAAVRINSDIITWQQVEGRERRWKIPRAPGERWVGLVLVFSTETGELLSIFPDGAVQRMRVGAANGLGAKYLARKDAHVYGLLGSGWQAGGQLMAMCAVRPIQTVKVYSPNEKNRLAFVEEWQQKVPARIIAVDSPEKAVKGSDIVGCATNSREPILDAEWLEPGMFLTCIRFIEFAREVLPRCAKTYIHWKQIRPRTIFIGEKASLPASASRDLEGRKDVDLSKYPELMYVLNGDLPERTTQEEITAFINNVGMGFQFAAVSKAVIDAAKEKGVGRRLPNEWFSELVHP